MKPITLTLDCFTAPITVDEDFAPAMTLWNDLLKRHGLHWRSNQTLRCAGKPVSGAIVKPASHGCHLVGHADDGNFIDPKTGHVFLHEEMQALGDPRMKAVITEWKAAGYRWGGDFTDKDPVHIDDDLYHRDPKKWQQLFDKYQNNA